jgi:hypothetical protein
MSNGSEVPMALAVLALAVSLTVNQTSFQTFEGTWVATHAGTTFARLEFRVTDGKLEGRIGLGDIHVDANGVVDRVTDAPRELKPIFDASLKSSTLAFASKDQHDTDRFEVTLTGSDAELHFVLSELDRKSLAAEGIPVPKPIRLTKLGR